MALPYLSRRLAVVLGYTLAAVVFTWPLVLNLGTRLTGEPGGDTGVYVWNQWVFSHEAIVRHQNPLTTGQILSLTDRVDLSQHNYTAFLNLLAMPLLHWLGVVATFNVVFLVATVLTALMAYLLARGATAATPVEAWLAGLVFAWSPVLVARTTGHFSLVAAAPLPAFLLCLLNAGRSYRSRDAGLAGLCMAWAAFCDAYYAVYCGMIGLGYVVSRLVRVVSAERSEPVRWRWALDLLTTIVAGLVVGLLFGRGGELTALGVTVRIRGLYTPVLLLTALLMVRLAIHFRPRLVPIWSVSPIAVRAVLAGAVACAGPLSPVLYGLGQRAVDGRLVMPPTLWRSSPRGVDLLAFFSPNPDHPLVRAWLYDPQNTAPDWFMEYTAAQSLIAIGVVLWAVLHAGYRPRAGWLWLTGGFALLALGPFVHIGGVNSYVPGPWAVLRYLPVVSAARMPSRFAVVATLGVALLFAGALAQIGRRWPNRRPVVLALVATAVVIELWPAPRTLYAARISPVYDIIAADPRPIRILELPFGVRDGVTSNGDFIAGYQFNQTRHEKRLVGGYVSRISRRRVERLRADFPMVDALIALSENQPLADGRASRLVEQGPRFVHRAKLGYVVIHHDRAPPELADFAVRAFHLREIARDGPTVLYVPDVH